MLLSRRNDAAALAVRHRTPSIDVVVPMFEELVDALVRFRSLQRRHRYAVDDDHGFAGQIGLRSIVPVALGLPTCVRRFFLALLLEVLLVATGLHGTPFRSARCFQHSQRHRWHTPDCRRRRFSSRRRCRVGRRAHRPLLVRAGGRPVGWQVRCQGRSHALEVLSRVVSRFFSVGELANSCHRPRVGTRNTTTNIVATASHCIPDRTTAMRSVCNQLQLLLSHTGDPRARVSCILIVDSVELRMGHHADSLVSIPVDDVELEGMLENSRLTHPESSSSLTGVDRVGRARVTTSSRISSAIRVSGPCCSTSSPARRTSTSSRERDAASRRRRTRRSRRCGVRLVRREPEVRAESAFASFLSPVRPARHSVAIQVDSLTDFARSSTLNRQLL